MNSSCIHQPHNLWQRPWASSRRRIRSTKAKTEDDFPLADYSHPMDIEKFRSIGHQVIDWIADYHTRLHATSPTTRIQVRDPNLKPGYLRASKMLPSTVPEKGEGWDALMADFEKMLPSATHWQSPKFFAYFPANTSFPATLADMLSGALNMIGFSWAAGPISTELEELTMDMLAKLCGLPDCFLHYPSDPDSDPLAILTSPVKDLANASTERSERGKGGGVIQGTTSEAVLVAMLAAQSRAMEGRPASDRLKLVAYSSDQAHSVFKKACMILSIDHVRILPTMYVEPALDLYDQAFALDEETLERAIIEDERAGLIPFFVCLTVGTTSSCAVDPVSELADVANKRDKLWTHVDAAYAGAAAICPDLRVKYFSGLDKVDSFSFNPHKGLLVNFDCCAAWFSDATYLKRALSLTPIFLQGVGNQLDLKDWQVPLGRRFRSLKLYFVLRSYGSDSLQQYVRHHYSLAQWFARAIESDRRFELAAKPRFGLVCFRLASFPGMSTEASNAMNKALMDGINEVGDIFLIHTELKGKFTLRLAVGSAGTQLVHVQEAWDVIRAKASTILSKQDMRVCG